MEAFNENQPIKQLKELQDLEIIATKYYLQACKFEGLEKNPYYKKMVKEIKAEQKAEYNKLSCEECLEITPALDCNMLCFDCYYEATMQDLVEQDPYLLNDYEYKTYEEVEEVVNNDFEVENREPGEPESIDLINKALE